MAVKEGIVRRIRGKIFGYRMSKIISSYEKEQGSNLDSIPLSEELKICFDRYKERYK